MCDTETIITRVRENYRRCESYSDTGTVLIGLSFFATKEVRFQTCFVRPSHLFLECQAYGGDKPLGHKSTIWSDGEHTRLQMSRRGKSQSTACPSLNWALSSFGGGTLGGEYIIHLLLPNLSVGTRGDGMNSLSYLRDDELGDEACYILTDVDHTFSERRFWISKNNFSIIKVVREYHKNALQETQELNARETKLAEVLNRKPQLSVLPAPGEERMSIEYTFNQIEFNPYLEMSIFNFPGE